MEKFQLDAMFTDENGRPLPAKNTLSEVIDDVILGLNALSAMSTRWLLRLALKIVIVAIVSFKEQFLSKTMTIITLLILITGTLFAQDTTTVQIGNKRWMKENLNVGNMVPMTQLQTNNLAVEKYCYNNLESNCDVYGGLYRWDEAMQYSTVPGSQGICPDGFHVPTRAESEEFIASMGADRDTAALNVKEVGFTHWLWPPAWNWKGYTASQKAGFAKKVEGRDTHGFKLLGGGYGNYNGTSSQLLKYGKFWTSTQYTGQPSWVYAVSAGASNALWLQCPYAAGNQQVYLSVRCIKN